MSDGGARAGLSFLDELDGCLLISFVLERLRKEFVLTCEAPFDPECGLPGREFWEFRFIGVSEFRRVFGQHPVLGTAFREKFRVGMTSGAWTVWEARSASSADGKGAFVEVSMGLALGTVQFACEVARIERVRIVPLESSDKGDCEYEDAATGARVEFSDPFRRLGVDNLGDAGSFVRENKGSV